MVIAAAIAGGVVVGYGFSSLFETIISFEDGTKVQTPM